MKTIALFGSTGKTGSEVLKQLIKKGYNVRVLVRNPKKLKVRPGPNLLFLKGDIQNPEDVNKVIQGSHAVINCIGHSLSSPRDLQTKAIQNIIPSMRKHGVKRLINLTSTAVAAPGDKTNPINYALRSLMELFLNKIYSDAVVHSELIVASELDWTIVRAYVLGPGEATNSYKVGMIGDPGLRFIVPRADVAKFIVDSIPNSEYFKTCPLVG